MIRKLTNYLVLAAMLIQLQLSAQITPEHVAKMQSISSSAVSNDGSFIAYTLVTPADPKKENSTSASHLYVLDQNTGDKKAYYTTSNVSQVKFRPNKGTITFVTKAAKDDKSALYEMDLKGGAAQKIFSYSESISSYDWHPDGENIVFVVVEKAPKPKTSLTYSPNFFEEDFGSRNAYVMNVGNNSAKPQKIHARGGAVYIAKWSRDGSKIALSAAATTSVDDSYMKQKVMVADARSLQIIADIYNEGKLADISWSPDNQQLALLAAKDIHDPTDGCILIVNATGGKPKLIDANYMGKYEQIEWTSPNTIHFLSSEGVYKTLGTINPNGSNRRYLVDYDDLNLISFSRAGNGEISLIANTSTYNSELFTLSHGSNEPRRQTYSNEWMKDLKMGKQELITYKTRDGKYTIEGLLIYPNNYVEGNRYPLITVVHGGPESHYSNGWLTAYSMPGQMSTAKGYAVFYPNYRGSTGRGTAFTYSSQGDLAGREFDDIVDGVDYLIAKGIADKNRVGVTGGSYGGYASAWMSTYYSDRFAAAVMFVGISNNISKFGTSDIPNEMYLVHSRKRIWEDWKWQLERSPIYYVDRAQTPLLIMHGADDPRVHPAQSMELYRHLKVRKPDVPVRLIYYPGEGHGNAKSGSKYDYNLRMMQWFDTYLKSGNAKATKPGLDLPFSQ